ncbi:hypothetical protein [Cupriavidus pinatubonensis]|uniref:Uncharacterized protein n=1 Tax=Cupriavidus pinatubonensis TaxID=248026 RepID=A0ABN7ZN72_9BURK|nr:hypothetical protein [Cupriavidus pinatubonensis]CAG9187378.1 hypothetical protein LMG23994_06823 [Cupriavidus pinatubonensis]
MHTTKSDSRLASASEIREIVGPVDDEVIARIMDIGPTIEDVRRACDWLRADEPPLRNLESSSGRKAEEVFEILDDESPDFDASGRPG